MGTGPKDGKRVSVDRVVAVFAELPSNPLLVSPDIHRLGGLAKKFGFVLVVDDTVSTPVNVDGKCLRTDALQRIRISTSIVHEC